MLPTQNKKDDPSSFLSYGGNQLSKKFNSQVPKLKQKWKQSTSLNIKCSDIYLALSWAQKYCAC
jgi:hypothetical protein